MVDYHAGKMPGDVQERCSSPAQDGPEPEPPVVTSVPPVDGAFPKIGQADEQRTAVLAPMSDATPRDPTRPLATATAKCPAPPQPVGAEDEAVSVMASAVR